jgi:hypothetical protein
LQVLAEEKQSLAEDTKQTKPRFKFGRSASQGIGAIADQGLFAISNFALNLILARQMAPVEFGAFSAAFVTFLLIATIYTAIVTEPMLVFALSSRAGQQRSYVKRVATLHWKAALLVGVAVACVGGVRYAIDGQPSTLLAYGGWALAAPLILWMWFARRTAYITLSPHRAALAGAGYLLCMGALILLFGNAVAKHPLLPCLLFAIPSAIMAPLLRFNVPLIDAAPDTEEEIGSIWTAHWGYGRWASLGGLCVALTAPIYFFVLSLDGCAAYRALMNIPMPLLQTYTALGPAFIAMFTPLANKPQLQRSVAQCLLVVSGFAVVLGLVAGFYSQPLLHLLYADKYTAYAAQLWPMMMYSSLLSASVVLDSAMRSTGRVRTATAASATAVAVSIVVGVPMAISHGLAGAVYGLVIAQFSALCVLAFQWFKLKRNLASATDEDFTAATSDFARHKTTDRVYSDV